MELLKRRVIAAVIFGILYTIMAVFIVGWRSDHLAMLLLVMGLILAHKLTYQIAIALSAFAFFWISYDFLGAFPNYKFNDVIVKDLYDLEVSLFGVRLNGTKVTLCEWFTENTNDALSLFAGASYLLWMPAPMAYTLYLFVKKRDAVIDYSYTFLLACLIGYIGYYAIPAAPPWYYINYGEVFDTTVPGSEGLLSEFDRLVGTPIFNSIYAKGGNPFAAIPSLHSAYPILSLLAAIRYRQRSWIIFFSIWCIGTWFGAVYSQHHYVIDVLLGIVCACLATVAVRYFDKFSWYRSFRSVLTKELNA